MTKKTDLQIAAASVLYTCARCEAAGNHEMMCHPADRVGIIGEEVVCDDCRENDEIIRNVPNIEALARDGNLTYR